MMKKKMMVLLVYWDFYPQIYSGMHETMFNLDISSHDTSLTFISWINMNLTLFYTPLIGPMRNKFHETVI